MPFVGDSFSHLFDWEKDPQRQEKIINARLEAEFDGADVGLSALAARVTAAEGGLAAIGAIVSSNISSGSAVSLTTNTAANITSIPLTVGKWLCTGAIFFQPNVATTIQALDSTISTASAALGSVNDGAYNGMIVTFTTGFPNTIPTGARFITVATTQTMYLVGKANFGVNSMAAYGYLGAIKIA